MSIEYLSTLDRRGGRFNESRPKNYIDQHIYDTRDLPTPGRGQPAFGFDTITDKSFNRAYQLQQDLANSILAGGYVHNS